MPRPQSATREKVEGAYRALVSEGLSPTVDSIHVRIGRVGSRGTIATHLREIREQDSRDAVDVPLPIGVVEGLRTLHAQLVSTARERANALADAEIKMVREELQLLAARHESALNERDEARDSVSALTRERDDVAANLAAKMHDIDKLTASLVEAKADALKLRSEHQDEVARIKRDAEAALARSIQETEDLRRVVARLRDEVDRAHEEAAGAQAELLRTIDKSGKDLQKQVDRVDALQLRLDNEREQFDKRLAGRDADLARSQAALAETRAALAEARAGNAASQHALGKERERTAALEREARAAGQQVADLRAELADTRVRLEHEHEKRAGAELKLAEAHAALADQATDAKAGKSSRKP